MPNVERTAEKLYDLCQDRSLSATQISDDLITFFGVFPKGKKEDLVALVKSYRDTGQGLEKTAREVRHLILGIGDLMNADIFSY